MTQHRRVAVTSPQTRLAHARRRHRTAWRPPTLDPGEVRQAVHTYRAQRRWALLALAMLFALLIGLPIILRVTPELDHARVLDIPVSWLATVVIPFPAMILIARWHLRRAERAEDIDPPRDPVVPRGEGPGECP
ncbi:hypothetical protein [Actinokineospora enzanensis]|uniref:hypothetical protein n=1 Tax=Actinokineospora enzanensis TaxID=155975 RepID=UPI00037CF87F|nr:hypothetical protein [Actinokineospora enzanensis]